MKPGKQRQIIWLFAAVTNLTHKYKAQDTRGMLNRKEALKLAVELSCILGGVAGFLTWLGIKPKDLAMTWTLPHILWLIVGLMLFAVSLWSSLRSGFIQKRTITHLQGEASKWKREMQESAARNLEYRATIERANTMLREQDVQHTADLAELSRSEVAYRECTLDRSAFKQAAENYLEKLGRFSDQSMSDPDPHIYPEFVDARKYGSDKRELQAYFSMVNRSESEARNIVLEPVEMNGKIVQFTRHRLAAPLLPKQEVTFYPDVVTADNKSVGDRERDLFHIFCLDYIALGDNTLCEATKIVKATYQDSSRNLFEVTCELVFDPAAHNDVRMGHRPPNPVIFTRNHKFRKIATAI